MPDNSKVALSTQTLDLVGDGTQSFTTTFRSDVVKVALSGVVGGSTATVVVDGTTVATIPLTAGAGSAGTTQVSKASDVAASNVNAQKGGDSGGYVRQANATNVGHGNFLGPAVVAQKPLADNVSSGKVITVTVAGGTAGIATVTLDKAGTALGVNPNTNTDSTY